MKNKTRYPFSLKLIIYSIVIALFFNSCEQNPKGNLSLNERFIEIYRMDIKTNLADLKELSTKNKKRYEIPYNETLMVQNKFDSIYNFIEQNNYDFKSLLNQISEQTVGHCRLSTSKKIDCLLNINTTTIDKNELLKTLLELNSSIITDFRNKISSNDYKFNRICVFVIPEKREIKQGETFRAYVVIGGIDTTALPKITFNNQTIQMNNVNELIQIKGIKKGLNQSIGTVNMESQDDGIIRSYKFGVEFNVK